MKVVEDVSLKPYNTFGLEARAARLAELSPDDDPHCVDAFSQELFVLGAGSDVVFSADYRGTVLRLSPVQQAVAVGERVTAWGGMTMDDLVQWTVDRGLYGLENLSAIPGTVGAAVVQNVGAYGVEAKDVVESIEVYDMQRRELCNVAAAECGFAYRDSLFKRCAGHYLVLRVTFRLRRQYVPVLAYKALAALPHDTAQQMRDAITDLRWQKLPRPEQYGSVGSFFKNPVVSETVYLRLREACPDMPEAHPTPDGRRKLSAGWLIDHAGWKGRTRGGAGVWPHNALVLYNNGSCTAAEVLSLAAEITADVEDKYGVTLTPEAIIV